MFAVINTIGAYDTYAGTVISVWIDERVDPSVIVREGGAS